MFGISSRSVRFLEMHHILLKSSRQKSAPRSPKYSARQIGKLSFIVNQPKLGTGLFEMKEERKIKRTVNVDAIETFIDLRLKTVFPAVAKPRCLLGPRNVPLFSLFFAVSNPTHSCHQSCADIAAFLLGRKR